MSPAASPSGEAELTDPWVALEPGADPAERVRVLRRAHETFTEAGTVPRPVRSVVADSWRRSARAGVGPDGTASVELTDGDLGSYRAEHPLARVMPLFRELMGTFAADGEHLLAVCDAHGRLLWVEGHPGDPAEGGADELRAGCAVGGDGGRDERAGYGGRASTGRCRCSPRSTSSGSVQPWTCAAAPVHDPRTGRVLGAVDITGGDGLAHPHSLGFVQAVARAAESQLALLTPAAGRRPTSLELTALGRDEALLVAAAARCRLSRRHSEILVLLSRHPEGLTGDELLCALYEDESVTPVTLRAELARLRRVLGPGLLASRPYRLTVPVESDVDRRRARLASGAVTAAARGVRRSAAARLAGSGGGAAAAPARRRAADGADRPPRSRPAGRLGARAVGRGRPRRVAGARRGPADGPTGRTCGPRLDRRWTSRSCRPGRSPAATTSRNVVATSALLASRRELPNGGQRC